MAQPELTWAGERLYESLEILAERDEANGWALAHFTAARASMLDTLADVLRTQDDGTPGWAIIWDPDRSPTLFLPFLARWYGITLDPGLSEQQIREAIKQTAGYRDGTPGELIGVARRFLSDPAGGTVYLTERIGGDPYHTGVATLTSETPDAAAVERAIMERKRAGEKLTYSTITGGTWADLNATHATWAEVALDFTDWADVRSDPTQT